MQTNLQGKKLDEWFLGYRSRERDELQSGMRKLGE